MNGGNVVAASDDKIYVHSDLNIKVIELSVIIYNSAGVSQPVELFNAIPLNLKDQDISVCVHVCM